MPLPRVSNYCGSAVYAIGHAGAHGDVVTLSGGGYAKQEAVERQTKVSASTNILLAANG